MEVFRHHYSINANGLSNYQILFNSKCLLSAENDSMIYTRKPSNKGGKPSADKLNTLLLHTTAWSNIAQYSEVFAIST